jgi:hypothetical protein
MGGLAAVLASLVRGLTVLLPAERRDWAEAVLSEAADVPAGRGRLRWLAGALRLVISESGVLRRLGYTVCGVAAGLTFAWLERHPGSTAPGVAVTRVMNVVEFLVPAALPWVTRPWLGPVAGNRVARMVRGGGYLAIYALMLVAVGVSRYAGSSHDHADHAGMTPQELANWTASVQADVWFGGFVLIAILGGYSFLLLALTSRRWAVRPRTLAVGAGIGLLLALAVYGLAPTGRRLPVDNPALVVLIWAGILSLPPVALYLVGGLAGRQNSIVDQPAGDIIVDKLTDGSIVDQSTADSVVDQSISDSGAADRDLALWQERIRQGRTAGLLAGGVGALVLAVVTVTTMLLFPHSVALEWGNPDRSVPHGTDSEWRMSLGDSVEKYEFWLLFGPLVGLALGAAGGARGYPQTGSSRAEAGGEPARQRRPHPGQASFPQPE